jgi:hypothetical protein
MNGKSSKAALTKRFKARPMLHAGVHCTGNSCDAGSSHHINKQPNASGRFRLISSLAEVQQAGWDAADNLIKNFPREL